MIGSVAVAAAAVLFRYFYSIGIDCALILFVCAKWIAHGSFLLHLRSTKWSEASRSRRHWKKKRKTHNNLHTNKMIHRQTGKCTTLTVECIDRCGCCGCCAGIHSETKNEFSGCDETQDYQRCPFNWRTTSTTRTATMTHPRQRRFAHNWLPLANGNSLRILLIASVTVLLWCDPVSANTKPVNYIAQTAGESLVIACVRVIALCSTERLIFFVEFFAWNSFHSPYSRYSLRHSAVVLVTIEIPVAHVCGEIPLGVNF